MAEAAFTCPRCFFTAPAGAPMRFCPRCGLSEVKEAAMDTSPMDVTSGGKRYRVLDRIGIGSIATVYRCCFASHGREVEGVFKIARDPCTNDLLAHEAAILRTLHGADRDNHYAAFLPAVEASVAFGDEPGRPPRQANVLRMHEEIRSPDELYSLVELRSAYPEGLDARDMAWIWRRLLTILGFAHHHGIVHSAVLPMHVLVEPREHKLLLIDWCCALDGSTGRRPSPIFAGDYIPWYKREHALNVLPTPDVDVGMGARCMIELLGGDPVRVAFGPSVEPAIARYFQRCLGTVRPGARKLLEDFDTLIDALWGPRTFRPLAMPPKGAIR